MLWTPAALKQTHSSPQTNTFHSKQSTALQSITSPTKASCHTLSCHDCGRPAGSHEYTHTLSSIIHWCMLQICKLGFIQAIRTFFFSYQINKKYMMSTHAVESMYSNIKNKQTNTYMYCIFSKTKHSPTESRLFKRTWIISVKLTLAHIFPLHILPPVTTRPQC